jgi:uncharacterized protein
MRILCLSDVHGDFSSVGALKPLVKRADLIAVAGDLTDFGGKEDVDAFFAALGRQSEGKPLPPVVTVGGNCDRPGARKRLEELGASVDGSSRAFGFGAASIIVIGSGGGSFHTGITPYERREAELAASLESGLSALQSYAGKASPLMVITHNPPWGTEADQRRGGHVGSRAFRDLLDALQPLLWLCGHIHESRSVSRCGSTLLVNPGPLREGYCAFATLDEGGLRQPEAELLRLDLR